MKQRALIYYFWLVIIGLTSMTCGENTPVEEANISSTDLPLAKENIYNPFRIRKARDFVSDKHKAIAKEKFEDGKIAISEGNIEAAIDLFILSLQYHPRSETYFYIGNIQLELKQHEEAINAYKMAKFIGYQPSKYLFYNMACAYAMDDSDLDGKRRAINYLRMATQNGYIQKDSLLTDKRLKNIRHTYEFNKIFLQTFGQNDDEIYIKFDLFTHLFPRIKSPIRIGPDDLGKRFNKRRRLNDPLTSFIGREEYIPDEEHYIAIAMLKKTTNFVAVLYLAYPVNPQNRRYKHFEIATYTWQGKNIDKIRFADSSDPDKYLCGEIDKDLSITLSTYQNIWEYDPLEYGYRKNRIEYSDFMYEEKFRIDEYGKIIM